MSRDSLESPPVQRYLSDAKYRRAFAPPVGRWWKSRLQQIALGFLERSRKPSAPIHQFASIWNDKLSSELTLSRCLVDGTSPAESVCFIYDEPVRRKNSLPYWPD